MRSPTTIPLWLALLALAPLWMGADVSGAPDITVDLSGVTVSDEEVAIDDQMGGLLLEDLGGLPGSVEVDAYHDAGSSRLFSIDTTATLGGVTIRPEDVASFDGANYAVVLDGSAEGVPDGANLDALTADGGDLLVSFDTTVSLDGFTFADEDIAIFSGGSFGMAFDASAAGFDPALDLDAAHLAGAGIYAVSFDGHGSHGGVSFADEDVVTYDPSGPTTTLSFDGSAAHAGWSPADLGAVALPEPAQLLGLLAGGLALAALARRPRA